METRGIKKKVKIQIIDGINGTVLEICNKDGIGEQITENKSWAGGNLIKSWEVKVEDILKAIKQFQYE